MRLIQFAACLLFSAALASPAFAQDDAPSSADIKKAASSYDIGRERYREGNFTEAAEKFEAADGFAPSAPALRLAIAARKEAGQLPRAATLAALALERYPGEEPIALEAQALIDEIGQELAKLTIVCDEPCELLLNNRIVHGVAAATRTLYVSPGSVTVRAGWSQERSQSETVDVSAGEEREISYYAPAVPEVPVTTDESPVTDDGKSDSVGEDREATGWSPAVFWTGVGVTGVAGGATVILGVNALNNPGKDVVQEKCEKNDEDCPEYKKGVQNQMYANIALGTTVAAGLFTIITGVWLTDWGSDDSESASYKDGDLSIRPTFAVGDGALLGASGTF